MNFSSRLTTLERAFDGDGYSPCDGRPYHDRRVVMQHEITPCTDCGGWIGKDGLHVRPNSRRIIIEDGAAV